MTADLESGGAQLTELRGRQIAALADAPGDDIERRREAHLCKPRRSDERVRLCAIIKGNDHRLTIRYAGHPLADADARVAAGAHLRQLIAKRRLGYHVAHVARRGLAKRAARRFNL